MLPHPNTQLAKQSGSENFPVASWLLPASIRQNVRDFYLFARGADTLADCPTTPPETKISILNQVMDALESPNRQPIPDWALPYVNAVHAGKMQASHGRALLRAFLKDAVTTHLPTLQQLLEYCRDSAVPVGRTLLELHHETTATLAAADALCIALQLLNHVQDCRDDYLRLQRIYLPKEYFERMQVPVTSLGNDMSSPALRQILNQVLDEADRQLGIAATLPRSLLSSRLRLETAWILACAHTLSRRLRQHDPLHQDLRLRWRHKFWCLLSSLPHELLR